MAVDFSSLWCPEDYLEIGVSLGARACAPSAAESWPRQYKYGDLSPYPVEAWGHIDAAVPALFCREYPQEYTLHASECRQMTDTSDVAASMYFPKLELPEYQFESLVTKLHGTQCNIIAASGQWIYTLEDAEEHLRRIELQTQRSFKRWVWQVRQASSALVRNLAFSFDDIVGVVDRAQAQLTTVARPKILRLLEGSKGRRKAIAWLTRHLQPFKFALPQKVASFCGVAWSRRTWHLLHGAHPPKALSCS